jgi:hypothetical protein
MSLLPVPQFCSQNQFLNKPLNMSLTFGSTFGDLRL